MAKGKVTAKSLRAGQTVYRVCGPTGSITKILITSRPFAYKKKDSVLNGTLWVNYRKWFKTSSYKFGVVREVNDFFNDDFSLTDAGIDGSHPGGTNRTFYTYNAAKRWSEYVKSLPKKQEWWEDDDDMWSPTDYDDVDNTF
ncbi:hypothetical protein P19_0262 [Aeromonas phage P19]|nr:hypothetical protein P19_0262 [Aeromonas phage P19]